MTLTPSNFVDILTLPKLTAVLFIAVYSETCVEQPVMGDINTDHFMNMAV